MILNIVLVLSGVVWLLYVLINRHKVKKRYQEMPMLIQLAQTIFLILVFVQLASHFGIELMLVLLTIATGTLWFGYKIYLTLTKGNQHKNEPPLIENARSFFPILLIVLLLRSFLWDPYRIPTGSLLPTLNIGDFILVNKYQYGLRIPVAHKTFFTINHPKVGDIMVFLWPMDRSVYFIKRVVGIPGDRIRYSNKILYRNDKPMLQQYVETQQTQDEQGVTMNVVKKIEYLESKSHAIYIRPDIPGRDLEEIVVPPGNYFVMGDNRDGSFDSRNWGFVPNDDVVGKASIIWLSWDSAKSNLFDKIRWNRIWKKV